MKLNKNIKYYGIVWLAGLIAFNIITFLVPNEILGIKRFEQTTFWVGYGFVIVAFIAQFICTFMFFKGSTKEKMFLRFPLIKIGFSILVISTIAGTIIMLIPVIPAWIGGVVCIVLTFIYILIAVKAVAVADSVSAIDTKVKQRQFFIRSATVDVECIMQKTKTDESRQAVKSVYESLRYSDPMSCDELLEMEKEIAKGIDQLKIVVDENKTEQINALSNNLLLLIDERNKKSKLLK